MKSGLTTENETFVGRLERVDVLSETPYRALITLTSHNDSIDRVIYGPIPEDYVHETVLFYSATVSHPAHDDTFQVIRVLGPLEDKSETPMFVSRDFNPFIAFLRRHR